MEYMTGIFSLNKIYLTITLYILLKKIKKMIRREMKGASSIPKHEMNKGGKASEIS